MFRCKSFWMMTCLVVGVAIVAMSLRKKLPSRMEAVAKVASLYEQEMKRFDSALAVYPGYFVDSSFETRKLKYSQLAYQYKKIEGLFTYFHPKLSYETFLKTPQFEARDFGPPFPDNWLFLGPFGIDPDSLMKRKTKQDSLFEKKFIERSVAAFRKTIAQSNYKNEVESMTEGQIFDALRLQMVRISTVGIANADFVIEAAGMPALAGAFDAWIETVNFFADQLPTSSSIRASYFQTSSKGKAILQKKPEFKSLNRMQFLTEILIPLSEQFSVIQKELKIESLNKFSALNSTAGSVYDRSAFNTDYFAPGEEAYLTKAKAELGKLLFFDPILSDNNERACASCHKPELAFTDGNIKSVKFDRTDLPRNAPTVINSAFQKAQFWDLRAGSLEDQLDSVVNNPDELHSSFENVIDRINSSEEYKKLFFAAFPSSKTRGIQRQDVKIAIACYERELTGLNARFDQYIRGDKSKMTEDEISGFNLYMGKAKCGTCHYSPLFNGALPPYFDFTDQRSIGVPLKDTMTKYEVDPDPGFSKLSGNPFFNFSFKIPTLRNIELTAPYMHNGVYKTLEQVIEFYDHAGGVKFVGDMRPGMKGLPFFMILPEKLNLTEKEKRDIVAFLKTLTDTTASTNVPNRLPRLGGKYASLNKRKLGGIY